MKRFVPLALAFVLSGCCGQALCLGSVRFVLTEAQAADFVAEPSVVRVCFDGACFDESGEALRTRNYDADTRTLTVQHTIEPRGDRGEVTLSVLRRDDTTLFAHTWPDVAFTTFAPNGETCGPVCGSAGPLAL